MSKRLRENRYFVLYLIEEADKIPLKKVLNIATSSQVNALSEIAANVAYSNIPLSKIQRRQGHKLVKKIENICDSNASVKTRHKALLRGFRAVKYLLHVSKAYLRTVLL